MYFYFCFWLCLPPLNITGDAFVSKTLFPLEHKQTKINKCTERERDRERRQQKSISLLDRLSQLISSLKTAKCKLQFLKNLILDTAFVEFQKHFFHFLKQECLVKKCEHIEIYNPTEKSSTTPTAHGRNGGRGGAGGGG